MRIIGKVSASEQMEIAVKPCHVNASGLYSICRYNLAAKFPYIN